MGLYFNIALFLPLEKINQKQIYFVGSVLERETSNNYKNKYLIKAKKISDYTNLDKNISKIKAINIYVNTTKDINFEVGDIVEGFGTFYVGESNRNYKGFNNKSYLFQRKIYGSIETLKIDKGKSDTNIEVFFYKIKEAIIKNIEKEFKEENKDFLLCILIGKSIRNDNIKEDFRNSNLSHILAISGMHVSYVILGINLMKIKNRKLLLFLELIILNLYLILTGNSVSCLRACIMNSLAIISKLLHRKNNIYITSINTFIFLNLYNVYNIFNAGMWLSFLGMFGIILFSKFIYKIFIFKFKIKNLILKKIIEISSLSISAQVMIFPIMMYFFNQVSFNFIISNLATFFLIGPIIILGYIIIILILLKLNIIVDLLKIFENVLVGILLKITDLISQNLKFSFFIVTPNILSVFFYYLVLTWIILKWKKQNIKIIRGILSAKKIIYYLKNRRVKVFVILFFLINFILNSNFNLTKTLKINFIDVGQGDCTLIITPENKKILIDGGEGNGDKYDYGKNVLFPYLLDRKINKIDYVFISHFDSDHVRRTNIYIRTYEGKKCSYRNSI